MKTLLCALLALSLFTGCVTRSTPLTPEQKAARVAVVCRVAAYDATVLALQDHPEWRPYFETASASLSALIGNGEIDSTDLASVLSQLPIKELKSAEAKLAIGNAEILYEEFASQYKLDVRGNPYVLPIATAVRDGILRGLQ